MDFEWLQWLLLPNVRPVLGMSPNSVVIVSEAYGHKIERLPSVLHNLDKAHGHMTLLSYLSFRQVWRQNFKALLFSMVKFNLCILDQYQRRNPAHKETSTMFQK